MDVTNEYLAWVEYYFRTEEFDRTLPGSWGTYDYAWIPEGGDAVKKSRLFAQQTLDDLGLELPCSSIAKRDASMLSHEERRRVLQGTGMISLFTTLGGMNDKSLWWAWRFFEPSEIRKHGQFGTWTLFEYRGEQYVSELDFEEFRSTVWPQGKKVAGVGENKWL